MKKIEFVRIGDIRFDFSSAQGYISGLQEVMLIRSIRFVIDFFRTHRLKRQRDFGFNDPVISLILIDHRIPPKS